MSSIFKLNENANSFVYDVIDANGVVQQIACFSYQCEPNGMVSFLSLFDEYEQNIDGEETHVRSVSVKVKALADIVSIQLTQLKELPLLASSHNKKEEGEKSVIPTIKQENTPPEKGGAKNLISEAIAQSLPDDAMEFDESYIPEAPEGNLIDEDDFDLPADNEDVEAWINVTSGNDDYKKNREHFREAAKTFAQNLIQKGGSLFELNDFLLEIKKQGYKEHGDENEMLSDICQLIKAGMLPTEVFITNSNFEHFKDYEPELSRIYDNSHGNLLAIQEYILKEEGFFSFYCDVIRISAYLKQKASK